MSNLQQRSDRRRRAILVALWTAIIGGSAGAAGMVYLSKDPELDPVSLCNRDALLEASSMVVVDTTDALNDVQRRRLKVTIEAERDAAPIGSKLTIVAINPKMPQEPIQLASVCNPGNAASVNPFFATRSRAENRWRETFEKPIDDAIAAAAAGNSAATSPIIQTIAEVLARPDFDARVAKRRLVLISDILQHQKLGYSQLMHGDLWKAYQHSTLAREVTLDLRGVAVAIDYLPRPQYRAFQGASHRAFWKRLLTEAGATEVNFIGMHEPAPSPKVGQPNGNKDAPARLPLKVARPSRAPRQSVPQVQASTPYIQDKTQ